MASLRVVFLFVTLMIALSLCFYARGMQRSKEQDYLSANAPDRQINLQIEMANHRSSLNQLTPKPSVTESELLAATDALAQYDQDFEQAMGSQFGGGNIFNKEINQLLFDRRFSKIFSYLLNLPREEAASFATELFDRNFLLFRNQWTDWLDTVETSRISVTPRFPSFARKFSHQFIPYKSDEALLAKNQGWSVPKRRDYFNPGPCCHGATAALFLCGYFSTQGSVDERIRLWDSFAVEVERFRAGSYENWQYHQLSPQNRAHILLISGYRNGKLLEDLHAMLGQQKGLDDKSLLEELSPTEFTLLRWDAYVHPNKVINEQVDSEWVVAKFPGFDATLPFRIQDSHPEILEALFKSLRDWRKQ